jgi:peptidoglycan/LPS O-acetylase OafA/YrhL
MQGTMEKPPGGGFYIRGLDGLRAISIALVFCSHLGFRHVSPGLFGVNVFFLLSGFLIATLMMREHAAKGRVSIKEFYLRRALRIFPPMYIVIGLAVVLILIGAMPAVLDWQGVLLQCVHLTNYYFIKFGGVRLIPGLEVYWSLAVEEHFYLVFPLVFVLGYGRLGARKLALILFALALAVLAWRVVLVVALHTANPYRTSIATDTRIDSILWGCILALWRNPALDAASARALASGRNCAIALVVLAATLIWRNDVFRETVRYTIESLCVIPLLCAAVLRTDWLAVRLLETRPMRWLGQISYTFYLCHFMFIELFELNFPSWPKVAAIAAALASTLIFSQLMRLTVEMPLARIRKKYGGA